MKTKNKTNLLSLETAEVGSKYKERKCTYKVEGNKRMMEYHCQKEAYIIILCKRQMEAYTMIDNAICCYYHNQIHHPLKDIG